MIYFIQEVGGFRNRIKIGYTNDVRRRLDELRSASSSRLKVLLVLPGDRQTEAIYHERFSPYRLHGEWFKFGLKLRLFVLGNLWALPPIESDWEKDPDEEVDKSEKIQLEINHFENQPLRRENLILPHAVTREVLTNWARAVLAGSRSPAFSHWTGAGKPFSRNDYEEFVHVMVEAGILIILPGKGTQLTNGGENALKRLIEEIAHPPPPLEDVLDE